MNTLKLFITHYTAHFAAWSVRLLLATTLALPQLASAALVVNTDATVTDTITGLMWDQCANGQSTVSTPCDTGGLNTLTWSAALATATAANTANYKGYSDWRVPNIKELESLSDRSRAAYPLIDTSIFNVGNGTINFWSSTSSAANPNVAWTMYPIYAFASEGQLKINATSAVRLVRGG